MFGDLFVVIISKIEASELKLKQSFNYDIDHSLDKRRIIPLITKTFRSTSFNHRSKVKVSDRYRLLSGTSMDFVFTRFVTTVLIFVPEITLGPFYLICWWRHWIMFLYHFKCNFNHIWTLYTQLMHMEYGYTIWLVQQNLFQRQNRLNSL